MTSDLPDWMRGSATGRYGGAGPNELSGRSTPDGERQSSPGPYASGPGPTHEPYAVGWPGSGTMAGDASVPPVGAPSGRSGPYESAQHNAGPSGHDPAEHTTDATAHYVPGSPATAHLGSDGSRRSGLVALAVLLVLGSFAYLIWHSVTWLEPLVEALDVCPPERGMACFTSEPFQRWIYAPVLAVVVAWGFASGAATEGRQGRARGYLHLLAGIAALVIGGLVSSL